MWQRWNQTTHIFEKSDNNGGTWVPLPLNGSVINEGSVAAARLAPHGTTHNASDPVYEAVSGFLVRGANAHQYFYNPNNAANTKYWRIINWDGASDIRLEALDDSANIQATVLTITRGGNASIPGQLTLASGATISNNGASSTVFLSGVGGHILGVQTFGHVVRFINGSGPYIQWDGSTWTNLIAPQYLQLAPAGGYVLVSAQLVVGAWGGPTFLNDTSASLRMDLPGLNFYWRSTGYNAFFVGQDNTVSAGHPSFRWTAVYAVNGAIQTSDIASKQNIRDNSLGLKFVEKLEAVEFEYKDDQKPGRIGFITQQVEEALEGRSFAALEKPEKGYSGLNYAGFVPVLVTAIQELSARVKELEKNHGS